MACRVSGILGPPSTLFMTPLWSLIEGIWDIVEARWGGGGLADRVLGFDYRQLGLAFGLQLMFQRA